LAVNTRTEYALRALLAVMQNAGEPISAAEICKNETLPKKYIEHLLSALRQADILKSVPGSKGGYILSREPKDVCLFDIMQAVNDTSWEPSCNQRDDKYCLGSDCGLNTIWTQITKQLHSVLKNYTLQSIHETRTKTVIPDPDREPINKKEKP